jgi:hypothetical protein
MKILEGYLKISCEIQNFTDELWKFTDRIIKNDII